ncbi:MAG: DoxX family protein [Bacteroidota bacterium]
MKSNLLTHVGLAFLRIVPSVMMLSHGYPKFQKLISGNMEFANPIGIGEGPSLFLAVIGEVVAPLMLIAGYKTKWAAVPALMTMLVAAVVVHGADPFNVQEKAWLYATCFATILLLGPGKFSIDKK